LVCHGGAFRQITSSWFQTCIMLICMIDNVLHRPNKKVHRFRFPLDLCTKQVVSDFCRIILLATIDRTVTFKRGRTTLFLL